jgi:hypothetical protein
VHFGYNFAMGPPAALMPDRGPVERRGRYAAVLGLGSMCGSHLGQIPGALLADRITLAYVVLAAFTVVTATVLGVINVAAALP